MVEQSSKRTGGMKPTFGNTSHKFSHSIRWYITGTFLCVLTAYMWLLQFSGSVIKTLFSYSLTEV